MTKTIVSITPHALDQDSRLLKMACSFARWGMRSIVVEGEKSRRCDYSHLGLHTISLNPGCQSPIPIDRAKSPFLYRLLKKIWHMLRKGGGSFFLDWISYLLFKKQFKATYFDGLKTDIPDADLYYMHSYHYFPLIEEVAKKNGAKIIYDSHDFYTFITPETTRLDKKWLRPWIRKMEKTVIKKADEMVTVSPGLQSMYWRSYRRQPHIIRNVHDYCLDKKHTTVREVLQLNPTIRLIVSVGSGSNLGQKVDETILALDYLPENVHLCFIGNGYESYQSYKKRYRSRLHFLSPVLPEEVVPFIQGSDAGVICYYAYTDNYRFALSNRFFQMIAAKLPFVFSEDLVEFKRLNDQFHFGQEVNVNDSQALATQMQCMIENRHSFKEALGKASSKLCWANEEKKLEKIVMPLLQ